MFQKHESRLIPQCRLVKLLEKVGAEEQRQNSRVDATKHCSFFLVREGNILMAGKELGSLLAASFFSARLWGRGDLVPGFVHDLSK